MYDLHIFYLLKNGFTNIWTKAVLGYNIQTVTLEIVLKHLASIQKVLIRFLIGLKIKQNIYVTATCILPTHSRTKKPQLRHTNCAQRTFHQS